MATKRLTESELRRIIKEETLRLREGGFTTPLPGVEQEDIGWFYSDSPPYIYAMGGPPGLDTAFRNLSKSLDALQEFADMKLPDTEMDGKPTSVKMMARHLVKILLFEF